MAEEYEVSPGRFLVSVNLGKEYEAYNTPQKAFEFLKKQIDELRISNPLGERPRSIFSARLARMILREQAEVMLTMHLEWAWLTGHHDIIRSLLQEDKEDKVNNMSFIDDFRT